MLTSQFRTSVIHRLSFSIWGLFLAFAILVSGIGYLLLHAVADQVVPMIMQQTAQLRAHASEGLFVQAGNSVERLRDDMLSRLRETDSAAALERFPEIFERGRDGLWRIKPGRVDTINAPTLYLHHGATGPDESTRLRAVMSYDLLRERGPALAPPFFSVYMDFVEDGLMVYARGVDWGAGATADATNADYPTMRGADPRANPGRRVFWTPVYFDQQAKTWMVSVIQPLDWQGRWVGTIGHDLSITTLLDAVESTRAQDGLQLILSADGNLISHPRLRDQIAAANGQLQVAKLKDVALEQVHRMILQSGAASGAGLLPDGSQWVAWSRIMGPDWYQVYLMPQSHVNGLVLKGLGILAGMGLISLILVFWAMRRMVAQHVTRPLLRLTDAVDVLGQGGEPAPVALQTGDELGRLAMAFDDMVAELAQKRALEVAHAQELQTEVDGRRRYMTKLEEERARLLALLGAMNMGILFVTADNVVKYCNATFMRIWQLPEQEDAFIGQSVREVFNQVGRGSEQLEALEAHVRQVALAPDDSSRYEFDVSAGHTLMLRSHPVYDGDKRYIGRLWIHEDVTREREVEAQLVYLAERDSLTGLFNRRRFEEELLRFFKDHLRNPRNGALLFFDLDEFKVINDTFGHTIGDSVLLRVSGELRALVRETDFLCRLGGDEFAVLMPNASVDEAQKLAERIVRGISQTTLPLAGQHLRLTTSIGIAHVPDHANTADDLITHADAAMYQAKHMGKNRWSVYRPDRNASQEMISRLTWNERISHALEAGLLRLHFQGVYHASSGKLAHLEVLVRMVDEANPDRLIPPGLFIGHAEKSGKILDIDRWVVKESIAVLARAPHLSALAVNISARSFDDPSLPAYISAELHAAGVDPRRLLVELTETSAVSDLRDAERFIAYSDEFRHQFQFKAARVSDSNPPPFPIRFRHHSSLPLFADL